MLLVREVPSTLATDDLHAMNLALIFANILDHMDSVWLNIPS